MGKRINKLSTFLRATCVSDYVTESLYHTIILEFFSNYQLNAHFLYSLTIYMLHNNP